MNERRIFMYVRNTGTDLPGRGDISNPYATLGFALSQIPVDLGVDRYFIDISGHTSYIPSQYTFPQFKRGAPRRVGIPNGQRVLPHIIDEESVNIYSDYITDLAIEFTDIVSISNEANTGFILITLAISLPTPDQYRYKLIYDRVNQTYSPIIDIGPGFIKISALTIDVSNGIDIVSCNAKIISTATETVDDRTNSGMINISKSSGIGFYGVSLETQAPLLYSQILRIDSSSATLSACTIGNSVSAFSDTSISAVNATTISIQSCAISRLSLHSASCASTITNTAIFNSFRLGTSPHESTLGGGAIANSVTCLYANSINVENYSILNGEYISTDDAYVNTGALFAVNSSGLVGNVNCDNAKATVITVTYGAFAYNGSNIRILGSVPTYYADSTSIIVDVNTYPNGLFGTDSMMPMTFTALRCVSDPIALTDVINLSYADTNLVKSSSGTMSIGYVNGYNGYIVSVWNNTTNPIADSIFRIGDVAFTSVNVRRSTLRMSAALIGSNSVETEVLRLVEDTATTNTLRVSDDATVGQTIVLSKDTIQLNAGIAAINDYDVSHSLTNKAGAIMQAYSTGQIATKTDMLNALLYGDPSTPSTSIMHYDIDGRVDYEIWTDSVSGQDLKRVNYTYVNNMLSTQTTQVYMPGGPTNGVWRTMTIAYSYTNGRLSGSTITN